MNIKEAALNVFYLKIPNLSLPKLVGLPIDGAPSMVLLLVTRPLPRDEGMAENHGVPEAGQLPKVWTKGRKETESRQRVHCWTVQNEMRNVLGRVSTGAAVRVLDSTNPRDKNLKEGCVRCSEHERGHSEHDEGAQVPRWKLREPVCQRI